MAAASSAAGASTSHRRTSHTLHATTKAPATGLGRELAGTASLDDVWMPSSVPWKPADAEPVKRHSLLSPHDAAVVELKRASELAALRRRFNALCHENGVAAPPMNAFERWRFQSKWEEEEEAVQGDPLLPVAAEGPPAPSDHARCADERPRSADESMRADLRRAGMAPAASAAVVQAVRSASARAATRVDNFRSTAAEGGRLRVRLKREEDGATRLEVPSSFALPPSGEGGGEGGGGRGGDASEDEAPARLLDGIRITAPYLHKLRELHARHGTQRRGAGGGSGGEEGGAGAAADAKREERSFRLRLLALLLRYHSIGGLGFQAALGGAAFFALQRCLGVNFECFASPLNCYYGAYCSAFPDVDAPFGSRGSFRGFAPRRGSYEVNPPFVDGLIARMAERLLSLLAAAHAACEPLTFVVVLPGWLDSEGYRALDGSSHLRAKLLVAAADHGFVDGGQHARTRTFRESPYDTVLFFLQSGAAAAVDEACVESVRTALARCTPAAESLASLDPRERVRGRSRKRPRWRKKPPGRPAASSSGSAAVATRGAKRPREAV